MHHHLWLPYTQMQTVTPPCEASASYGHTITLADGRTLVDGISSWWTACHGYNHPHILDAMQTQIKTMPHIMLGGLVHQPALDLSKKLCSKLPDSLNHVFFSESGSVAVEVALKMALQYWLNQGYKTKQQFIYFENAYHGDTFYAMSLCCPTEGMHALFNGLLAKQALQKIPTTKQALDNFEQFIKRNQQDLAGLIIEPLIQGAGGMKCHSPETLNNITRIAQKYDLLVIFDEIFTGFGRTGSLFALEQIDEVPDIITLGKALTGGVSPLAATIASKQVFEQFLSQDPQRALMHGPTFMGHALGCRAAIASLELFENNQWQSQVKTIETHLINAFTPLTNHPCVKKVRVKGAMGVIELYQSLDIKTANTLKEFYLSQNLWIRPFGKIIYLTPALNISFSALQQLTAGVIKSLELINTPN